MIEKLGQNIDEYSKQMELGHVPAAYRGLMEYMMGLRTHFINKYPAELTVGAFYQGYMDITYFSVAPIALRVRKLKLPIVFNHLKTRFEIWLSAQNQKIRHEYSTLLELIGLSKDYLISKNPNSIIELIVAENPNFNDLHNLTADIEAAVAKFTKDITEMLEANDKTKKFT